MIDQIGSLMEPKGPDTASGILFNSENAPND